VLEDALTVLKKVIRGSYLFLNDDTDLLNGAEELVEVDFSFVLNVEKLETLGQKTLFALGGRTFLGNLGFHLSLEAKTRLRHKDTFLRACS